MSKTGELVTVLGNLANLANSTAQLAGNLSGKAAENALNGALDLGKQVADMVNKGVDNWGNLTAPNYQPNHTTTEAEKNRPPQNPPTSSEPKKETPKQKGDKAKLIDVHCTLRAFVPTQAWVFDSLDFDDFSWGKLLEGVITMGNSVHIDNLKKIARSVVGFDGNNRGFSGQAKSPVESLAAIDVKFKVNAKTLEVMDLQKDIFVNVPKIYSRFDLEEDPRYPSWGRQIKSGADLDNRLIIPTKENEDKFWVESIYESDYTEVQIRFEEVRSYLPTEAINKLMQKAPNGSISFSPNKIPFSADVEWKDLIRVLYELTFPSIDAFFKLRIKGQGGTPICEIYREFHELFPAYEMYVNEKEIYTHRLSDNFSPNRMDGVGKLGNKQIGVMALK